MAIRVVVMVERINDGTGDGRIVSGGDSSGSGDSFSCGGASDDKGGGDIDYNRTRVTSEAGGYSGDDSEKSVVIKNQPSDKE